MFLTLGIKCFVEKDNSTLEYKISIRDSSLWGDDMGGIWIYYNGMNSIEVKTSPQVGPLLHLGQVYLSVNGRSFLKANESLGLITGDVIWIEKLTECSGKITMEVEVCSEIP